MNRVMASVFAITIPLWPLASYAQEPVVTIYNVRYSDLCRRPGFEECRKITASKLETDFISTFERRGYSKATFRVRDGVVEFKKSKIGQSISDYYYSNAQGRIGFIILDIPLSGGNNVNLVRRTEDDPVPHVTSARSPGKRIATYYDLKKIAVENHPRFSLRVDGQVWDFEFR